VAYSHIKGIIFDLGSTLIEYETRSWDIIAREGQKLAYDRLVDSDHSLPDFETFNGRLEEIKNECRTRAFETLIEWEITGAFEKLLTEYGLERVEERSLMCMDSSYEVLRNDIVLCEDALETVMELNQRGYKIGLISNTIFPGRTHEVDLDNFRLKPYIDFRIYSSEYGYRKPYPGIYEEGLKLIGLAADKILFVGDRYKEDVEGPRKAGMKAVLKYWEGREYPDSMPSDIPVLKQLPELLKLLDVKSRK
jgi:putative hydrolase of the HAD superfamily